MTVETWDPRPPAAGLTPRAVERLLEAAARLDEPRFGLDREAAAELAPVARHRPAAGIDWAQAAEGLGDDELIALVRLFTLAESALPGWEARDESPVIPLAAVLRRRGRYPADLTAWIRAHSDNRFLPYGNLMARL
ncbi:MAG TPA: hypothetical protein VF210_17645 [Pseudomonadales bacterium]